MAKWTMNDLKAKGIHINSEGIGKKIEITPKKKNKPSQKKIDAALKKIREKAVDKLEIDPKDFIEMALKNSGLEYVKELKFDEVRLFRFDFCIPSLRWAAEYQGLQSEKSAHTTLLGYTKDTDKKALANDLGWVVREYTILNYKNIIKDLENLKTKIK